MAVSTIDKEFITKTFSHTFPAFGAGGAGSRADYVQIDVGISGYKPVSALVTPLYAGYTFTIHTCFDNNILMIIQNRAGGSAEPNAYNCVAKVLYQKN